MITFFCVVWRTMKVVYKLLVFRLVFRELDGILVKFQSARKYTKVILKWPVLSLFQESVLKLIRCLLHQSGCHSFIPSAWAKPQSRTWPNKRLSFYSLQPAIHRKNKPFCRQEANLLNPRVCSLCCTALWPIPP